MFNLFKKLHHSDNLIYANQEGNIIFSDKFPRTPISLIEDIIVDNILYEDKIYKAVYKEYKKHYAVYDRHPWLLHFRIPIIAQAQYVHRKLIEPKNYLISVSRIEREIPEVFRIPQDVKELILECLQQSSPYMANKEEVDIEDFEKYLEFKFLSEWPSYFKYKDKYLMVFLHNILSKFIMAGGSNSQTISNIINRITQSKIKEATSN